MLARRADGGPDRIAPWVWTEGRLWVQIDNNREAPFWTDVVEHLGVEEPYIWSLADGQRVGRQSAAATSGTARCTGGHTGTATWTLDASGAKVWDTSGCREVQ